MYNELATIIGDILKDAYGVSTDVTLHPPSDPSRGDLTTNVCMQVSKKVGVSPREIASKIVQGLKKHEDLESVEVAGPGFLNLTFTIAARLKLLLRTKAACEPKKTRRGEAPVIVEYSQPNVAKPLGVHHILSTVIGQAIANIYRHQGFNVVSWNYIGDWGTQFGKLLVAVRKWGSGKEAKDYSVDELLDLYVRFHEEAEKDPTLEDEARAVFRKLEQGGAEVRAFWKDVVDISIDGINRIYERLHVSFDVIKGESFYESKMMDIVEEGKERGVFQEGKGGALIVEFPEETKLPVALVLKADGGTLYLTRDLALARDRSETYHPQKILHVVDVSQELYFKQLIQTIHELGWDIRHIEHVVIGRMSFPDRGMSTRKGNIINLEQVLKEAVERADRLIGEKNSEVRGGEREALAEMIGTGAFVYAVLSQNRKQNIVFTWEKALTFEGNSGPYLQYTHARARSVLRKASVEAIDPPSSISCLEGCELLLMRHLAAFPEILEEVRSSAMPHKLTQYLYSLCQEYNSLYNALPILQAGEPRRTLRLALSQLTADVLRTGAELLTLCVPDRM